jgi:hypothetical protein
MNREADYTIKGFLYQFNVTLEQLLLAPVGSETTVEGIIEDIDISTPIDTKAIQCKYHESKDNYSVSDIAKPILQMLVHYSQNKNTNIHYILYAHFPNETVGEKKLLKADIESILETKNQQFISSYISKLKPPTDSVINDLLLKTRKSRDDLKKIKDYYLSAKGLALKVSIDDFLKTTRFKFIIGNTLDGIVKETAKLLADKTSLTTNDVDDLFYPNAIQIIANKSIKHNSVDRIIDKESLINELESTKKIAISRWTKELKSYNQLLKTRRADLKNNLQQNHRLRYFIFEESEIEEFEENIVNFITDYLNKYHHKIKLHSQTPVFCIKSDKTTLISSVESRLFSKGVRVETGYKGEKYFQEAFLREPKRIITNSWFEFHLRLCKLTDETTDTLNGKKCHDFFVIGKGTEFGLDLQDVNVEHIDVSNFKELKYLLLLTESIN